MKVLSTDGLTKLIQLIKSNFIAKTDVEQTSEVTLATVATTGSYNDLVDKPSISDIDSLPNQNTNSGAISTLKLWQGTEYQWKHCELVTWNNYQTDVQAMWTEQTLPVSTANQIIFVHNKFFIWGSNPTSATRYCSTDGINWTECSLSVKYWSQPVYINNKFITIISSDNYGTIGKIAYSEDGITWTESDKDIPGARGGPYSLFATNDVLITYEADFDDLNYAYSTDFGETWTAATYPNFTAINNDKRIYGNGKFVVWDDENSRLAYSVDGINWTTVTLENKVSLFAIGNDVFVYKGSSKLYYSYDCAVWTEIAGINGTNISALTYGNGKFVCLGKSNNKLVVTTSSDGINWTQTITNIAYSDFISNTNLVFSNNQFMLLYDHYSNKPTFSLFSTDGMNWTSYTLPVTICWNPPVGGNGIFIASNRNTTDTDGTTSIVFTSSYDSCYILDSTPTTSSQVYSEPEITSTKTISSINDNNITLSDGFVYNKNTSGNVETYRTVGDIHPNYICFINNVGVKIGNITIAGTNGVLPVNTYTKDEIDNMIGNVETSINTVRGV